MTKETTKTLEPNTIVTASDNNYTWGIFLLVASIMRAKMPEKILIGAASWSPEWLKHIGNLPNVEILEMSHDKRCPTTHKPHIMLEAKTDRVTWVDADGIFSGNCSKQLVGEKDCIYSRTYTPNEMIARYKKGPRPLDIWLKDNDDMKQARTQPDVCAAIIGVSLSKSKEFLKYWEQQMKKVLPTKVTDPILKGSPYRHTDEDVLNSVLTCWSNAPKITQQYQLNIPGIPHFIHFPLSPKPWQGAWTSYNLKFYDELTGLVTWCRENNLLPDFEEVPASLEPNHKLRYQMIAPFLRPYKKIKSILKS